MPDLLAVQHFCIPSDPGDPGVPATPMGGRVDALPAVLKKDLAQPGGRYRFACSAKLQPGPQHTMTHLACFVNCVRCRKTKAWLDAPDDGPEPKDKSRPRETDSVAQFLNEPAESANG